MAREKAASNVLMRVCIIMYYSTLICMWMSAYVVTTNNIYVILQVYEKCDICVRIMYILRIIICVCIYDTNTNNICVYM